MADTGDWRIEPIRQDHVRSAFDCGIPQLNDFIRKYARQSEGLRIVRTFVAVKPKDNAVRGYYSMRAGQVEIEDLPAEEARRLPRYPVPVVHFARLDVDKAVQGQGLGETLLVDALGKAHAVSKSIGALAVEVVAVDDRARDFYRKYGFLELRDDKRHLYLPMRTVESLYGG